jgi:hypothetical protein
MVRIGIGAAVVAAALSAAACTRNASSDWAQTSPIIQADAGGLDVVRLGMREG